MSDWQAVLAAIRTYQTQQATADWPVSEQAKTAACELARILAAFAAPLPVSVTPTHDGSISFTWREPGMRCEAEVTSDGRTEWTVYR